MSEAANRASVSTFSVPRRHLPRMPELDALRGIMLLGMTLTHLPTAVSHYVFQPFGFVGWAEGFVLLSAVLAGRVYGGYAERNGFSAVSKKLWRRCGKLYAYHLALLAVAFTFVAALAVHTQEPALQGLLDFYLAHRALAVISSVFLVYCPPLLDILPMYIAFLFLTPAILYVGWRWGWKVIVVPSVLLWMAAQFGLREFLWAGFTQHTGLAIPLQNLGAFNLYAWQLLWVLGLCIGAKHSTKLEKWVCQSWVLTPCVLLAVVFVVLRFQLLPYLAAHPVDQGTAWQLFDKWHLGVVRLVNFGVFVVLFTKMRARMAAALARNPLVFLGKSSLEVFCVHVLFVFGALSLVGDGSHASVLSQIAIVAVTLAGLFAFAYSREDRRSRAGEVRTAPFLSSLATPASCSEFRPGFFLVKNFVWMLAQKFF